MKKVVLFAAIIGLGGLAVSFVSREMATEKKVADQDALLGMLYQQKAAEYKALCLQSYALAKKQVDACLRIKGKHKPFAIVTDLDETALDNTPGEAFAFQQDIAFDLKNWWLHGQPGAVPGSVDFFNYAAAKGFHIYYVSNRLDSLPVVNATRVRMHSLGFPHTEDESWNKNFLFLPAGSPSTKEPRRNYIEQTRRDSIVLLLGDNLGDINKAFDKVNGKYQPGDGRKDAVDLFAGLWGSKYIVFPNAYYGDWEGSLYDNKSLSLQQKYEMREQLLKTYNFTQGGGH